MAEKGLRERIYQSGYRTASQVTLATAAVVALLLAFEAASPSLSPDTTRMSVPAVAVTPDSGAARSDDGVRTPAPDGDTEAVGSFSRAILASARAQGNRPALSTTASSPDVLCGADADPADLRCARNAGHGGPLAPGPSIAGSAPPALTIGGRVLTEEGTGVRGISVFARLTRLYGEQDAALVATRGYEAVTDSLGRYEIAGLPDGEYAIRTASREPFRPAWTTVRAGVAYADLVLVREEIVVVQGRVVDDDGDPIEGVIVLPVVLGVASATTDRDGRYRLAVTVEPDARDFSVRFRTPGFTEETRPVNATGQDEIDLDVLLRPVSQWTTVEGTVAATDGTPLAGRSVELRATDQPRVLRAVTDGNGRFLFPAVEADAEYFLDASGAPDHGDDSRRVRVTVDQSRFDIEVEPLEYGDVTGRMVNLDGAPIPNFHLSVTGAGSRSVRALVTSDRDGNFVLDDAPAGELVFANPSTPSMLVRGVRLEAGDIADVPLVLDWGEHEIRGLVVDRRGNPVPASRVVLKWAYRQNGISSMSIRRTAADAQGNFLFSRIGPGPHRLEIDAPGHPTLALEHDAGRQGYDLLVRLN